MQSRKLTTRYTAVLVSNSLHTCGYSCPRTTLLGPRAPLQRLVRSGAMRRQIDTRGSTRTVGEGRCTRRSCGVHSGDEQVHGHSCIVLRSS